MGGLNGDKSSVFSFQDVKFGDGYKMLRTFWNASIQFSTQSTLMDKRDTLDAPSMNSMILITFHDIFDNIVLTINSVESLCNFLMVALHGVKFTLNLHKNLLAIDFYDKVFYLQEVMIHQLRGGSF